MFRRKMNYMGGIFWNEGKEIDSVDIHSDQSENNYFLNLSQSSEDMKYITYYR